MRLDRLWVTDFRNHASSDIRLDPRLTLITGPNGHGKTNLLEAVSLLAGMRSFRGAPPDAMIAQGAEQAVIRAHGFEGTREMLIELELNRARRSRMMVNKQVVRRARDLGDALRVVTFSPDDLELVKGAPGLRRSLLDEVVGATSASFRQARGDLDRVLKQRNVLLKQSRGRLDEELSATLSVWDAKFTAAGEFVARSRRELVADLQPRVQEFYTQLAGSPERVQMSYVAPWMDEGLAAGLDGSRGDDVRRGTSTIGPHRDELGIELNGLPARTHASQGEQRSLALALRLASHRILAEEIGSEPLVLLDDVFSELDDGRARRLVACLPDAQTLLTSATGTVPSGVEPGARLDIAGGRIVDSTEGVGG